MFLKIFSSLAGLAFLHSIFMIITFCFKKSLKLPKVVLILLLVIIGLIMFDFWVLLNQYYRSFPNLIFIFSWSSFLIAPLYFFYIKSLTEKIVLFKPIYLIHTVPVVLSFIWYYFTIYSLPNASKIAVVDYFISQKFVENNSFILFYSFLIFKMLLGILYCLVCIKILNKTEKQWKKSNTNTIIEYIVWLKVVNKYFLVYWSIALVVTVLFSIVGNYPFFLDFIIYALFSFIVFYISYVSILYPSKLFVIKSIEKTSQVTENFNSENVIKQIKELMISSKPYTNLEYKISDLSSALNIPSHVVSRILNQHLNKNFYDFINAYRVEEFKNLQKKPEAKDYTLIAIAYDAGFNSKSSFNRIFKRHTGVTPSAYVKSKKDSAIL